MIELKINPTREKDLEIKNRLDEMFLAKEVLIIKNSDEPEIIQGGETYKGELRIEEFFNDLDTLYAGWYEDRCDKYENEDGSQMF